MKKEQLDNLVERVLKSKPDVIIIEPSVYAEILENGFPFPLAGFPYPHAKDKSLVYLRETMASIPVFIARKDRIMFIERTKDYVNEKETKEA